MAEHPEDHYTIRVGSKTIDINRKTGEWKEVDSTAVTEGEWDKTEKGWEFTPEGGKTTSAGRPRLGEQVLDEISSGTQTSGVIDDPQVLSEITLGEAELGNTQSQLFPRDINLGDLSGDPDFRADPFPPSDTSPDSLPIGAPSNPGLDKLRGQFREPGRASNTGGPVPEPIQDLYPEALQRKKK